MTRDDVDTPAASEVDEDSVLDDAAESADEQALEDAGLPREGANEKVRPERRAGLGHRLYNGEAGLDVVGKSADLPRDRGRDAAVHRVDGLPRVQLRHRLRRRQQLPAAGHRGAAVRHPRGRGGRRRRVASAQIVGGNTVLLRTEALDNDSERAVVDAVSEAAGITPEEVSPESVSAEWGNDITDQAIFALVVFLAAVTLFLALRFQLKMAVGAMAALVHDIVVTAGIYSLIGFEVTPSTVIGFLTILGFSLYDTVVVFDKVDENVKDLERSARMTWSEAANLAINQTLMRSINTSVIALLPVAGLLFVGAGLLGVGTLKDLALVLFVGLAAGTYSSIVLATPIVADLKEREPAVKALRKRVMARRASAARSSATGTAPPTGPVASARRSRPARAGSGVAVAELPDTVEADVVIESPSSVRPEPGAGGTTAPRPGQRPQRPGSRAAPAGKKRR